MSRVATLLAARAVAIRRREPLAVIAADLGRAEAALRAVAEAQGREVRPLLVQADLEAERALWAKYGPAEPCHETCREAGA